LEEMLRRRVKQTASLNARIARLAKKIKERAKTLPPGEEREEMMRKAEDTELALRMTQWMSSPGLQPGRGTVVDGVEGRGPLRPSTAARCSAALSKK
jgi:hypothetical protein